MAVSVKAYLEKARAAPEIRRFTIDQGASTNFVYFSSKVMQVFPGLSGQRFTLCWKDAEDDHVAFSSDDELMEALGAMNDNVFKVYIKVEEDRDAASEGVHHPGVVCDGCEGQVYGIRFKCSVCPDYDLCGPCERKGLHPEHTMTRITTPRNPFMAYGHFGMFGGNSGSQCGFGVPPPHCRRWREQFKKFTEAKEGASASAGKEQTEGQNRGNGDWQMPPQWQTWCDRLVNDAQVLFGGMHQQQGKGASEKEEDKSSEASAQAAGTSQTGDKTQKGDRETYLKNIGATIAAMLDPFGIDVDYDVQCHGNSDSRSTRQTSGTSPGTEKKDKKKAGPGKPEGENKPEDFQMQTETTGMDTEEKMDQTPSGSADTSKISQGNDANVESPYGDWTILQDTPSRQTTGETSSNGPAAQGKPHQFSFMTPDRQTQGQSSPGQQATAPLYPQIPEPTADPKIAHALEQMKGMGFNDDGGWLTRLLTAKDGDIGRVLDAVKPNQKR